MQELQVQWGTKTVQLKWVPSDTLPPQDSITSVHALSFVGDRIILVNHPDRGWDFIGGHVEKNEDALACIIRESDEEASIDGSFVPLGYIEVDNTIDPSYDPATSKYPPIGRQVYYKMSVEHINCFGGQFEILERTIARVDQVPYKFRHWNAIYDAILQRALEVEHIDSE